MLRSLATELYKDPNGRRVTTTDMGPLFTDTPQDADVQTGMIYVVRKKKMRAPHLAPIELNNDYDHQKDYDHVGESVYNYDEIDSDHKQDAHVVG